MFRPLGPQGRSCSSGPARRTEGPTLYAPSALKQQSGPCELMFGEDAGQHPRRPLSSLLNLGTRLWPRMDDPIPLPARCTTPGPGGCQWGLEALNLSPWKGPSSVNSGIPLAPSSGFEWMSESQADSSRVPKNTRCSPECTGDLAQAGWPWGPHGRMPGASLTCAVVRLRERGSEWPCADAVVLGSAWEGSEGRARRDAVGSLCLAEWGSTLSFLRVLQSGGAIWEGVGAAGL